MNWCAMPVPGRESDDVARPELDHLVLALAVALAQQAAALEDVERLLLAVVEVVRVGAGAGGHERDAVAEVARADGLGDLAAAHLVAPARLGVVLAAARRAR